MTPTNQFCTTPKHQPSLLVSSFHNQSVPGVVLCVCYERCVMTWSRGNIGSYGPAGPSVYEYIWWNSATHCTQACFTYHWGQGTGSPKAQIQSSQNCITGLLQDCGIANAVALEIPESCGKPMMRSLWYEEVDKVNFSIGGNLQSIMPDTDNEMHHLSELNFCLIHPHFQWKIMVIDHSKYFVISQSPQRYNDTKIYCNAIPHGPISNDFSITIYIW